MQAKTRAVAAAVLEEHIYLPLQHSHRSVLLTIG